MIGNLAANPYFQYMKAFPSLFLPMSYSPQIEWNQTDSAIIF